MKRPRLMLIAISLVLVLGLSGAAIAQITASATNSGGSVPSLINYSGLLKDNSGKPLASISGVTFLLYNDEDGGSPVWLETQNVTPDRFGHYTVQLGATAASGLPPDLFQNGEARWLAVQIAGEPEQPRVMLLSVPYAMKAGDAATLGGLPASAFVQTNSPANRQGKGNPATETQDFIPMFTNSSGGLGNSILFQSGTTEVGIGTTTPAATLEVNGTAKFDGLASFASTQTFPGTLTGVTAGTGITVTGSASNPTVGLNIPYADGIFAQLGAANLFTKNQATTGELAAGGAPSHNIANGAVEVDAGNTNKGSYLPGLSFGGGGESISSNRAGTTNLDGIDFYTKTARRMSLTNGGNFGIGTATPSHLFEVDAAATNAQMAMVSSGTDAAISVKNTASGGQEYWIDSGSGTSKVGLGNFAVYDATAGATRFVISAIGTVGIGTTTPGAPLEVDSNSTFGIVASGGPTTLTAIEGSATATSGLAWGVEGITSSDSPGAFGVFGNASNTDSSSTAVGVYGQSLGGFGVGTFGQYGSTESATGQSFASNQVGVWGDAGNGNLALAGVFGTADNTAAGVFENNSSSGWIPLQAYAENTESGLFEAVNIATGGSCLIDNFGDLSCTGSVGGAVPLDGGTRQVAMPSIQSPRNWFEDAGEGQLSNGRAVVTLDGDFTQTVNTNEKYEVFLTPYGECKGLYVTNRTANSFEVHELNGGVANVSFGFRIMALRKNYENVRFADRTADLQKQREMTARMHARKGTGQSHDPQRSPLLKPAGQSAELRPAGVR